MPLILSNAHVPEDISVIIKAQYAAYHNPHQRFFEVFNPTFGEGPEAQANSINVSTERYTRRTQSHETEFWQKVVDSDTGEIAAAALWAVYTADPFEGRQPADAYWWPEGPQRNYVNEILEQGTAPLVDLCAYPHVALKNLFTHPNYRGRGAADLVMASGIRMAEDRGVDLWLTSWSVAKSFYERHGFQAIKEIRTQPRMDDPPPEWLELDAKLQPLSKWAMKRSTISR